MHHSKLMNALINVTKLVFIVRLSVTQKCKKHENGSLSILIIILKVQICECMNVNISLRFQRSKIYVCWIIFFLVNYMFKKEHQNDTLEQSSFCVCVFILFLCNCFFFFLQFHNGTNSEIDQKCTQKVNKKGLCDCETVVHTI